MPLVDDRLLEQLTQLAVSEHWQAPAQLFRALERGAEGEALVEDPHVTTAPGDGVGGGRSGRLELWELRTVGAAADVGRRLVQVERDGAAAGSYLRFDLALERLGQLGQRAFDVRLRRAARSFASSSPSNACFAWPAATA